jgi:prepilin-type N-terminal cleavage/methylation domain-containing protein
VKKQEGFTLLEYLVGIAILAILLLLATPYFSATLMNARAAIAKAQILFEISVTREAALLQHTRMVICPSRTGTSCGGAWEDGQIIFSDKAKTGQPASAENIMFAFGGFKQASLQFKAFPQSENLVFNFFGATESQNGTFSYRTRDSGALLWQIVLNQAGRARVVQELY